jgi:adenylate cyclase
MEPLRDRAPSRFAGQRFAGLKALLFWLDQRPIHFALIAIISTVFAVALSIFWQGAQYFDDLPLESYFRARGAFDPRDVANKLPQSKDIVLIETSYLMPRPMHAELLRKLRMAKVVAFDFMFVDQESELRAEEKPLYSRSLKEWRESTLPLAHAIGDDGNVILGTWPEQEKVPDPQSPARQIVRETWQRPPRVLWRAARAHGHLAVEPGITRHVRLFENTPARTPCLGLAIAAEYLGVPPETLTNLKVQDGVLQLGAHRVRVGDDWMRIDFVGGRESFESLENHAFYTSALQFEPEDFKDKIVIIGESSYKSKEILETPFGPMPGMQIHANIVATLLSAAGAPLDLPQAQTVLIALATCLLLITPLLRLPLWGSLLAAVVLVALTVLLGAAIFVGAHKVLPLSTPLFAILLTYNAVALYEYRRARETLGRFVGQEMLAPTLSLFSRLQLGGRIEEASAFFCDLRGYTALTEKLGPADTARLIGQYTSTLVRVVRKHGGRPIDYQGDGAFMLFEPALCGQEYARRAILAAIELQEDLHKLRERWKDEGAAAENISVGIGIETGSMMIGLVGATDHLKQGAIGDAVNVASRVQRLNLTCGYAILITSTTRERAGADFCEGHGAVSCGVQPIRGRSEPLEIYGMGDRLLEETTGDED